MSIIPDLSYNAVFNALISNNKFLLNKIVQSILDYWNIDINVLNKELMFYRNTLPVSNYMDKQLICDYIIKVDDSHRLNIEINRELYPGLKERNTTYVFQIFYSHFKVGSEYKDFEKFFTFQINFNKYKNPNGKRINKFLLLDVDDICNSLTENIQILNIDIESCYKFVYNNSNKDGIHNLEIIAALINCDSLDKVSKVLESELFTMEEKEKLLNSIKDITNDKEIQEAIKFEDNIEYRFEATREKAYDDGFKQGTKQTLNNNIINMLKENASIDFISKVTGKDIDYITKLSKEIQ